MLHLNLQISHRRVNWIACLPSCDLCLTAYLARAILNASLSLPLHCVFRDFSYASFLLVYCSFPSQAGASVASQKTQHQLLGCYSSLCLWPRGHAKVHSLICRRATGHKACISSEAKRKYCCHPWPCTILIVSFISSDTHTHFRKASVWL